MKREYKGKISCLGRGAPRWTDKQPGTARPEPGLTASLSTHRFLTKHRATHLIAMSHGNKEIDVVIAEAPFNNMLPE